MSAHDVLDRASSVTISIGEVMSFFQEMAGQFLETLGQSAFTQSILKFEFLANGFNRPVVFNCIPKTTEYFLPLNSTLLCYHYYPFNRSLEN